MNDFSGRAPNCEMSYGISHRRKERDSENRYNTVLLHCVERMLLAETHHQAFDVLYNSLKEIIDIDAFAIIGNKSDPFLQSGKICYNLLYATFDKVPVKITGDLVRWFKSRRNVPDLANVPLLRELSGEPYNYRSLISVPFGTGIADSGVIICLQQERAYFSAEEHALICRLATYTERTLRSLRLAERNQILADVIEGSQAGMMLIEPHQVGGEIVYVNKAFEALTGFNIKNMHGMTFLSDSPSDSPERTRVRKAFKKGRSGRFVLRNPRRDGSKFANEIHLERIENDAGELQYMFAAHADVSEQIEQEAAKRLMQEKLRDLHRNESIAQLAGGVAHDFNNLLAVINGSAELIKSNHQDAEACLQSAERIETASTRAAKMINRFLDLGSIDQSRKTVDLGSLLTESRDLLNSVVSSETQFVVDLGKEPLFVTCNQTEILRIMLNLIQNAQDAIGPNSGIISQSLKRQVGATLDASAIRIGNIDPALDYAVYSVSDTGCGMDEDVINQLFGSIFTTKGESGSGVGMLAIAEVVRAHEGAIRILSTPGNGSAVEIFLPIDRDFAPAGHNDMIGTIRLDGIQIVLVDDDQEVSDVISAFLEGLGAQVSVFDNAPQALASIQAAPESYSALLTDYSMPKMCGARLAEEVNAVAPHLAIVIITALARKISDPRLKKPYINALLAKPVDLSALAHILEKLMWDG